jgi:hypothetical protein
MPNFYWRFLMIQQKTMYKLISTGLVSMGLLFNSSGVVAVDDNLAIVQNVSTQNRVELAPQQEGREHTWENCLTVEQLLNLKPSPVVTQVDKIEQYKGQQDTPSEVFNLYLKVKNLRLTEAEKDAIACSLQPSKYLGELLEKVKQHEKESFGLPSEYAYLRLDAYGKEIQSPCILEIWPEGQRSPIHEHSEAYGIVHVVKGPLRMDIFNPVDQMEPKRLYSGVQPSYCAVLQEGTAWLSEEYFQVHQVYGPQKDLDIPYAASFHIYGNTIDKYFLFLCPPKADPTHCPQNGIMPFLTKSHDSWDNVLKEMKEEGCLKE